MSNSQTCATERKKEQGQWLTDVHAIALLFVSVRRHKSAIRFSQAWEEAIQRYGKLVRFGRVHAQRERELARTLPAKFGRIPTVVIYANGQFQPNSKTFLDASHKALAGLAHFISDSFPNTVEPVDRNPKDIRGFMSAAAASASEQATVLLFPDFIKQAATARKQASIPQAGSQQQRFQQQMLQTQRTNEPSLTFKAIARKFQYSFRFGQVQQLNEPNNWKTWIKNVSATFKCQ